METTGSSIALSTEHSVVQQMLLLTQFLGKKLDRYVREKEKPD